MAKLKREPRAATASVINSDGACADLAVTERIEEVVPAWDDLEAGGLALPSQRRAVVEAWIESQHLQARDCVFVSARIGGRPLLVVPLLRRRHLGAREVTWLMGDHLGAYAPLVDVELMAQLPPEARRTLWRRLFAMIARCDLVRLPHMPATLAQSSGLSDAVVMVPGTDGVHVARYPSWAVCDGERRDKRRRKVDRQQGGKLAAMGEVRFETVGPGPEGRAIIAQMFAQRAERFKLQGIRDPFRCERVKGFYQRVLENAGGLLHVLRVDGDVVAVRYNIVAAGGLFSLITSMHCSPSMQAGSPGKQNLLHAMQSVFDDGYAFVDMGKGESEEKRLWCNEIVALETAQLALSPIGRLAMAGLSVGERAKGSIKSRPEMFDRYRRLRSRVGQWGVRA